MIVRSPRKWGRKLVLIPIWNMLWLAETNKRSCKGVPQSRPDVQHKMYHFEGADQEQEKPNVYQKIPNLYANQNRETSTLKVFQIPRNFSLILPKAPNNKTLPISSKNSTKQDYFPPHQHEVVCRTSKKVTINSAYGICQVFVSRRSPSSRKNPKSKMPNKMPRYTCNVNSDRSQSCARNRVHRSCRELNNRWVVWRGNHRPRR